MKLTLKNFKCFYSEDVTFSDLTVLVGPNASGKSSVIQALLLLREFFDVNRNIIEEVVLKKALPRAIDLCEESGLDLLSANDILHHNFSDEFIEFCITEENNSKCKIRYPIPTDSTASTINISSKDDYSIDQDFLESSLPGENSFHYLCAERLGPRILQRLSNKKNPTAGFQGEHLAHVIATNTNTKIEKYRHFPLSK